MSWVSTVSSLTYRVNMFELHSWIGSGDRGANVEGDKVRRSSAHILATYSIYLHSNVTHKTELGAIEQEDDSLGRTRRQILRISLFPHYT